MSDQFQIDEKRIETLNAEASAWALTRSEKPTAEPKNLKFSEVVGRLGLLAIEKSPEFEAEHAAWKAARDQEMSDLLNPSIEKRFAGIVGKAYAACRLENYRTTGDERVIWTPMETSRAAKIVDQLGIVASDIRRAVKEHGRQIVWYGKPGVGKDHLAASMMWSALSAGLTVKWINGAKFALLVRDQLNYDSQQPAGIWLRQWTTPDVLTISDPDGEHGKIRDDVREHLYNVVDTRSRDKKPTWITINGTSENDLSTRLGPRIWDRLRQSAWILHCNWPSGRKPRGTM